MKKSASRRSTTKRSQPTTAPASPPTPDDFLYARTGMTKAWWVAATQEEVARSGRPNPANKDHDIADPRTFLRGVVDLVVNSLPSTGSYDPNMRAGLVMGYALVLWGSRLQLAKIRDPRRPVALRREAYRNWLDAMLAVQAIALDEREDATYFPGQVFEPPFQPKARNGKFV